MGVIATNFLHFVVQVHKTAMSIKKFRFTPKLSFMVFFVFYFTTFNTAPLPTCILVPEPIKVTALTLLLLPLYNALTEMWLIHIKNL
jgi:antibiotic biosynthesis monooxygenase (ABM) superfamily enzyme